MDDLKRRYIEYYSDVPVQKYAAMSIGRDEDTIIRWRKDDAEFADAVQRSKAEWIRKKIASVKAEFALERLAKEVFSAGASIEESDGIKSGHDYLREIAETIKRANVGRPPSTPEQK